MSFIVKSGESRTYSISGKKVKAIMFNCGLVANAVNVAITPADFDATKVFITIDLFRQNVKKNLFSDNMMAFLACSFMANFGLLHPKNSTITNTVLLHDVAVVEKQVMPYFFEPSMIYDLENDDHIDVTVQFTAASLVGANLVGSTLCYIDIVEIENRGYEKETMSIETSTIKSGESRVSFPLGMGIRRIVLLNYDKDSVLAADAPINTMSLTSDKVNYNCTNEQKMAERQFDFFEASTEEPLRRQSLVLYDGSNGNINNVQVELLLNPSNVNVGANVLVVWRSTASAGLILHAATKENSDKAAKAQRHGLNIGNIASASQLKSFKRV